MSSFLRWSAAAFLIVVAPRPLLAQRLITQSQQTIKLARGASAVFINPIALQRISVGDPAIAEATALNGNEVLINGKSVGSTSLLLWDNTGVRLYTVEVAIDFGELQAYLRSALTENALTVAGSGSVLTLSGEVHDTAAALRAAEIAKGSGATVVINNLTTPSTVQVLLQVRFAEVNRSALESYRSQFRVLNPQNLDSRGDWTGGVNTNETTGGFVDGALSLGLFSAGASFEIFFNALKGKGLLKTLAEPNLVTLPGKEAYFLAGGEFPYPSIQGSGGSNAVTVTFREFGIRLRFTPTITRTGTIRLHVAPEVSSLDFANGLTLSGFQIPSLLTRRADTEVEMREGQYLVIAGLMDNSLIENANKIPLLGDLPILGQFFRSKDARQRRTELLVLISPRLISPTDRPTPLPTGEPADWKWKGNLKRPNLSPPDSAGSNRQ